MGYSMKGSPHKMGTIKGTSAHASAVKQKTTRELELEFEREKEANRQAELERKRKLEESKEKEKEEGTEGRKASEKWVTKRNENIDAYNQEIELLEESGASQAEIDKVRRKKDKENAKLEKGQFDWKEFAKAAGASISGLGASWGTGRWLGGEAGEYDFRREVDEGEEEKGAGEEEAITATDTQAETKEEEKSASEVAEEHADDSEFEAAFRKARKEQGPGGTFDYKGKPYTTNYKEEEE